MRRSSLALSVIMTLAVSATMAFLFYSNSISNQAFAQSISTNGKSSDGTKSIVILSEGQRNGPLLVKEIFSNHITGLQYKEFPRPMSATPITMYRGDQATNGCNLTLTLLDMNPEKGTATFLKNVDVCNYSVLSKS